MTKPHQQFIERQRKVRASTQFDADKFQAALQVAKSRLDKLENKNVIAPIIAATLELVIHSLSVSKGPTND